MGASTRTRSPGIDQEFADQIQSLLGAGGDEDIFGLRFDPVARDVPRDHFAQRLIAFGRPVLQSEMRPLLEHLAAGLLKPFAGKQFGRRQAAGEGDNLGSLGQLQQFADG